jgi:hypothetical protein
MSKFVPDPFAQQIAAALVGMSGFIDGGVLVLQSQVTVQASALVTVSVAPPPAVPSFGVSALVNGGTIGGLSALAIVQVMLNVLAPPQFLVATPSLGSAAVFVTESPVISELAEVFAI